MRTLLISTCQEALSEREFVRPISKILDKDEHDILHFEECNKKLLLNYDKIIICGTSLQDSFYLECLPFFDDLLKEYTGSIIGICSGMQILTSIFGVSGLIDNLEIGTVEINTIEPNKLFEGVFQAYNLHNYSVRDCDKFTILASSKTSIQAVKHVTKEIYGISFHPEVRNEEIISNFLKI